MRAMGAGWWLNLTCFMPQPRRRQWGSQRPGKVLIWSRLGLTSSSWGRDDTVTPRSSASPFCLIRLIGLQPGKREKGWTRRKTVPKAGGGSRLRNYEWRKVFQILAEALFLSHAAYLVSYLHRELTSNGAVSLQITDYDDAFPQLLTTWSNRRDVHMGTFSKLCADAYVSLQFPKETNARGW